MVSMRFGFPDTPSALIIIVIIWRMTEDPFGLSDPDRLPGLPPDPMDVRFVNTQYKPLNRESVPVFGPPPRMSI